MVVTARCIKNQRDAGSVWSSDNAHEIMLRMNKYGPLGTLQTTATVGGHTWSAYRGTNGSTSRPSANGVRSRGWFGDVTIGNVQFGYEITSSSGG